MEGWPVFSIYMVEKEFLKCTVFLGLTLHHLTQFTFEIFIFLSVYKF